MCFANSIWDKERVVSDADLPVTVIETEDKIRMIQQMQMEKLEHDVSAHLNRHQFLETLVLIAIEKYHESECEIPMHEAVRRFIDQEILGRIQIEPREKVRNKVFYTREINLLFKANELQL